MDMGQILLSVAPYSSVNLKQCFEAAFRNTCWVTKEKKNGTKFIQELGLLSHEWSTKGVKQIYRSGPQIINKLHFYCLFTPPPDSPTSFLLVIFMATAHSSVWSEYPHTVWACHKSLQAIWQLSKLYHCTYFSSVTFLVLLPFFLALRRHEQWR